MILRPATDADVDDLVRLRTEAAEWLAEQGSDQWAADWPDPDTMLDSIRESVYANETWCLEVDNRVIGTLTLNTRIYPGLWTGDELCEPARYAHRVIVSRAFAGSGLGAELLDWAGTEAAYVGARWLRVDVWTTNTRLQDYYRRQGFTQVRTVVRNDYPSGALFQRPAEVRPTPRLVVQSSSQLCGYVVRNRDPLIRLAASRLSREGRDRNQGAHNAEAEQVDQPSSVHVRVYVEFADQDTASALEIPAGAEVLVRDRVLSIGEQPTQLAVSRYPRTLTKGTPIEHEDTGPGGVLSRLEDLGHTIGEHTERVSLHCVTAAEAAALQVPTGGACLRILRTTRSSAGRVVEVNTMTLTGSYVLVYEIPAR